MLRKLSKTLILFLLIAIFFSTIPSVEVNAADNQYAAWIAVFDPNYYMSHNEAAAKYAGGNVDLLWKYFIQIGSKQLDQASEEFNPKIYIANYPGLARKLGNNPLMYYEHYAKKGKAKGLNARFLYKDGYDGEISYEMVQDYYASSVFVGDSVMKGFHIYALSKVNNCVKKADHASIVSYSLSHALTPVAQDKLQPMFYGEKYNVWDCCDMVNAEKVFLLFGTNELGSGNIPAILDKYYKLIAKIREVNPEIKVYVISMTPIYPGAGRGGMTNANVNALNAQLKANAEAYNYTYINLHDSLIDANGNLKASYSSDQYVHMTPACYGSVWEKVFTDFAISEIRNGY